MRTTEPELHLLSRYLDAYRGAIRWKVEGLSWDEATRSVVPSGTSLLGIVKHMAFVERAWFQRVMDQREVELPGRDDEFVAGGGETIEQIVALFDAESAISRDILAGRDPDEMVPFRDGHPSVREIVVHMIEETARHAGHMDIIREQIDGQTGGFPPDGLPLS